MNWTSILMALTLAVITAWLVFMENWEPWRAAFLVGGTALVLLSSALGAILLLAKGEDRREVWDSFIRTIKKDLDEILRYFRIRK